MAVYKPAKSRYWWYKFTWRGVLIRRSTKQTNKRVAEQMEAAQKTALAKGEVGLREKRPAPTFEEFSRRFMQTIAVRCASKPATVGFYREKVARLLEYLPLATARLDEIDEALIEGFVQQRREHWAPATTNRALATLRRALWLAYEWKLIASPGDVDCTAEPGGFSLCFPWLSHRRKAGLSALPRHFPEPPALEDAGAAEIAQGLRGTLVTAHRVDPAWGSGRGCLHHHAHRRPQQHHGFTALRAPDTRGAGAGFRAAGGAERAAG